MGRRRSSEEKPKKRKKVTARLLTRKHAGKVTEPYRIMEEFIGKHHQHLADAKIAIAWRFGWTEDADGRLQLGQVKKGSDLDREMHGYDFVLLLNHEAWTQGGLDEKEKRMRMDHELTHCALSIDTDGEAKKDEEGRIVYRTRGHDYEEFSAVAERHGRRTHELAKLAVAGINDSKRPLLQVMEGKDGDGASTETPVDDWRKLPLSAAGLNDSLGKKLTDADLDTIGKLSDFMAKHGDWWPRQIPGVGEKTAEKIADRLVKFWAQHPEYCEEAAAPGSE